MAKYDKLEEVDSEFNVKDILVKGEQLLWQDKPNKKAYVYNQIFNNILVIIIWLSFDSMFMGFALFCDLEMMVRVMILGFMAIHLLPVWIWLSGIIIASKRCDNTNYCLTNKRIIINTGFIGMSYKSIYYTEIKDVSLKVGIIDKILKVGDIIVNAETFEGRIADIENAYKVYTNIQQTVMDIQADIAYPNALRPDENKGYNTKYIRK